MQLPMESYGLTAADTSPSEDQGTHSLRQTRARTFDNTNTADRIVKFGGES